MRSKSEMRLKCDKQEGARSLGDAPPPPPSHDSELERLAGELENVAFRLLDAEDMLYLLGFSAEADTLARWRSGVREAAAILWQAP